jgi:LPXTG-site transpeptidase (sortase) family protein
MFNFNLNKNFISKEKIRYCLILGSKLLVCSLFGWGIFWFLDSKKPLSFWKNKIVSDVTSEDKSLQIEESEKPSVFGKSLEPIHEDPVRVYAAKITEEGKEKVVLDAFLVQVDVSEGGQMEVPSEWYKAGWYRRSAQVGEEGNIVINGHYDNDSGRPAAFYNLKTLGVNDKVYLVDSFGRKFTYQVTKTFYVDISDEDRVDRVMSSDGKALTLVTCGGMWVPSRGTYSNRLVVRAQRLD